MEVVHLLLSLMLPSSIDWGDVLRTVVRVDFLKRARNIDMEAILEQPRLIDYICRRQAGSLCESDPGATPTAVQFCQPDTSREASL